MSSQKPVPLVPGASVHNGHLELLISLKKTADSQQDMTVMS